MASLEILQRPSRIPYRFGTISALDSLRHYSNPLVERRTKSGFTKLSYLNFADSQMRAHPGKSQFFE